MRFSSAGLYLHIPFCSSKCAYCDFNSLAGIGDLISDYLRALRAEMAARSSVGRVGSVFIGGGTPTVLTGWDLSELIDSARRYFPWPEGSEVTIEANPGPVDRPKLAQVLAAGANRLSLGVQSFNDRLLSRIGRIHRGADARAAARAARDAGFENLNLDLIFGLPGQTVEDWRSDLRSALELEPDHLSCYSLKVEPGTSFAAEASSGRLELPGEESELAMFELTRDLLAGAGFEPYEISNFARPGRRCQHNLVYWRNEEYLGCGAGATSYLDRRRQTNIRDPRKYIEAPGLVEEFELTDARTEMIETVMMSLRIADGLSEEYFLGRFGLRIDAVFPEAIDRVVSRGLASYDGVSLKLTPLGLRLANQAIAAFI